MARSLGGVAVGLQQVKDLAVEAKKDFVGAGREVVECGKLRNECERMMLEVKSVIAGSGLTDLIARVERVETENAELRGVVERLKDKDEKEGEE